ncbi:hypothetical protein A3G67_04675 [Candidatus Roizmanbacteria bacterium RIFCSPLOWO2_12_FULL_40_12]|uniref:Uncharacterized protein n=1 Tax=Candidatus Roizmanbacteria bacterium RIFCSPLOWO2_01_FULL_40_42 TaxID=1802066 RepID=A0A1F7J4M1_9BACT|nr:MAG: hypothetical protein A2779_04475 [Candidatus Roizmanbacteria bacterium RIFCSPHIGHO2_01_FULL_40_98]OGK27330.1 MAG: hypothetical protein A3C31_04800 [Candidatus Roizmanbacteria bacterium RIFCSPHIGHO2_02_FULL_40_53]OGK30798.1 MAG: hypothetical protein A2W49_02240 [Candidatus Roizmanbacteria bacterium RIFCSPHIGHO2_12_41_18]OGK36435.1 MAG: hypothetical protein A3E69_02425 [Candidatus Roizmanbacteria bacterium RIFCSPHIGHO2_12_FULL_40_130]OGK50563.1 MAG: hypothetical protein A3B50_02155 [Candi
MNRKEFLLISIGVFCTVIAWLMADIYHAAAREYEKDNVSLPLIKETAISKEMVEVLKSKNH